MDVTRAKVYARFNKVLADDTLAKRLEISLWNWTVLTCQRDLIPLYWENPRVRYRYTTRAQSLEFNLTHPRNPGLVARVLDGSLSVKAFANMTPQEMFPEQWEAAYQQQAMRQLRRETDVDASNAPDGAYTCGKCKSKKTVYTSVQIRSADEPATIFVRCLNCAKAWKD